jgi:hypothetical protein
MRSGGSLKRKGSHAMTSSHDDIELVSSFDDKHQLAALFKAAALGRRSPEEIVEAFRNSR